MFYYSILLTKYSKVYFYKTYLLPQNNFSTHRLNKISGTVICKTSKDSDPKEDFLGNFTQMNFFCLLCPWNYTTNRNNM